jgi:hypothetical protein
MRYAALVFVVITIAWGAPWVPAGQAAAPVAKQPAWAVGDTWTYLMFGGETETETVDVVGADYWLLHSTAQDTDIAVKFDFSPNEYARFQWPLKVGERYAFDVPVPGFVRNAKFHTTWKVEARESVTVPAGTFDAFRVTGNECRATAPGGPCGEFTVWYAPQVKNRVRITLVTNGYFPYAGKSEELVSYAVH